MTATQASWSIGGDPVLLGDAAARLRTGPGADASGLAGPAGEFVMLAVARLLDAVATSVRNGRPVDYQVVNAATDIARHVTRAPPRYGSG